ncbi:MAG: primosomal protein N' [Pseudomonadota bacterium]
MAHQPFDAGRPVAVLTTQPLDGCLDYAAPEGGCALGDYVEVPLGPRRVLGVVWGPGTGDWPVEKLRGVARVLDVPPMTETQRKFIDRAAEYTLTPAPAMLRLAVRVPDLGGATPMRRFYRASGEAPERMTDARRRVLEVLEDYAGAGVALGELAKAAGVGTGVVKGLVAAGAVQETEAPRDGPYPRLDPDGQSGLVLTPDQRVAAEALRSAADAHGYGTTLLKGVTGSGKTEVYLEAVAACLAAGRQALVLLPEIALTSAFLHRVERRFGARPAEWHSGVTGAERRRCWHRVADGSAQLVVGARSSLFLPYRDLGLIVVDEEHDTSYKQEDGVLYNARDMSVLRASLEGAQVVLASATPSLETLVNAQAGKYARLDLPSRIGAATMPEMRAIDMRSEGLPADRWISSTLAKEAARRFEVGEQALFFLNRRGYAPVTLCRACGHQIGCPQCDARMVEHRFRGRLICHQCGHTMPIPTECPACGVEGKLAALGPGIERLGEEAAALFPDARIAVLSSDLFPNPAALRAQIEAIAAGEADLVLGTQLVAKGHNFPKLTLVGAIDADLGLQGSDLRAAERTFQLMRQVAGRAGRADRPGLAMLQTYQPEHPVIRAILSGADEAFWRTEADERQALGMPPFGRLAGIVISAVDLQVAQNLGTALARCAGPLRAAGADLFGPAPAPIARIRGRHRIRLLVKAPKGVALQPAIRAWLGQVKVPSAIRLSVDIDPQSFL